MRACQREFVLLLFVLCFYTNISAQRNGLTIGLNLTYLRDWENRPFNFPSPEVGYSIGIKENLSISSYLNFLYGSSIPEDFKTKGDVWTRMWFSNDFTLDYKISNVIFSAGPTFRYRNERTLLYFYPQPNPFEIVTDPKRGHVDFGGILRAGYQIKVTQKNNIVMRLSYRIYNHGVNPLSLGAFYNFTWKKKNSR